VSAYEILANGGTPISLCDTALLFRIYIVGCWFIDRTLVQCDTDMSDKVVIY